MYICSRRDVITVECLGGNARSKKQKQKQKKTKNLKHVLTDG